MRPTKTAGIVERMEVRPEDLHYHEHVARYNFACRFLGRGLTLDIACGTGYGVYLLNKSTKERVIGADVDVPSLKQAGAKNAGPDKNFIACNGTALPFRDSTISNVVTLETIEHIEGDKAFVTEIARVLKNDGVCVLSTPDKAYSTKMKIVNPYHVREYRADQLNSLLSEHFESVEFFYQGFSTRYDEEVKGYADKVKSDKKTLPFPLRWTINTIYKPIKRYIPPRVSGLLIKKWLHLRYPQPAVGDITISNTQMPSSNVFVVVCRRPLPRL